MAKKPRKIDLGVYAAGEIPAPLVHVFKDADKVAIPITGWTRKGFRITGPDGAPTLGIGVYETSDGANGEVTYTWVSDDMQTFGAYSGVMWVQNAPTNPTIRLASDLFVWEVYDAPGATPPVD
jgi:hypothetical protein